MMAFLCWIVSMYMNICIDKLCNKKFLHANKAVCMHSGSQIESIYPHSN